MTSRERHQQWPYGRSAVTAGASAMVASTDRYASEVGVAVMRTGGNAVDAAVAVSFALAVVNPEAGNVGGGGFLVLRTADGETAALDFRSAAPGAATRDMFADGAERSLVGHLAAAVPGSVRGLWEAHRRYGSLPWETLVEPAVGLAGGFVVGPRYLRSLVPDVVDPLRRFPSSAEIFLPEGEPPRAGQLLRQLDLAATLRRIRDRGADGFYQGETADRIVEEMDRGGGLISRDDLAEYRAIWREPIRIEYRDHVLVAMPPSSSGGTTLAETCHVLGGFALGNLPWHGPEHLHLLAEAWRRAFADRNEWVGDPAFAPVPIERMCSPEYGALRARDLSRERASSSAEVGPGALEDPGGGVGRRDGSGAGHREGEHTTHFSIVGPAGDAVALTTTINTWYGSKLVVPDTGVLLNNDMDDFTTMPGRPNYFGLVQGEANAIEPGKRMLSAMTPTLVLDGADGSLRMALGSAGGPRIITGVFQVVSSVVDHGLEPASAIAAPRIHHQHVPDEIQIEPGGFPSEIAEGLRAMGHRVVAREEPWGDVHAVVVGEHGMRHGISDPRRGGAPAGF